jgi:integrase
VARDGVRKAIRLGKATQRDAETFKIKLEVLPSAKLMGNSPDRDLSLWLVSLGDDLYDKLAAVGLIEPRHRVEPPAVVTLGGFLNAYLERRGGDVKGGTCVFYGHTVRNLTEFFGSAKPLSDITPGDADDFRRNLQKTEKLSAATVVRRCALARTFFKDAVRRKLIDSNPFDGVGNGSTANPERQRFIDRTTIAQVMDACPSAEWRLLVAMSRFGGVRVPSEAVTLRWQDIDWHRGRILIHSPKTEHHAGKATRVIPLFAEIRAELDTLFDQAPEGAEFVFDNLRRDAAKAATGWKAVNLRTHFTRIIKRAGLTPWPKLWHNLRASRQTELTETFPSHVVTAWLGNSERIAEKLHFRSVGDSTRRVGVGVGAGIGFSW